MVQFNEINWTPVALWYELIDMLLFGEVCDCCKIMWLHVKILCQINGQLDNHKVLLEKMSVRVEIMNCWISDRESREIYLLPIQIVLGYFLD